MTLLQKIKVTKTPIFLHAGAGGHTMYTILANLVVLFGADVQNGVM